MSEYSCFQCRLAGPGKLCFPCSKATNNQPPRLHDTDVLDSPANQKRAALVEQKTLDQIAVSKGQSPEYSPPEVKADTKLAVVGQDQELGLVGSNETPAEVIDTEEYDDAVGLAKDSMPDTGAASYQHEFQLPEDSHKALVEDVQPIDGIPETDTAKVENSLANGEQRSSQPVLDLVQPAPSGIRECPFCAEEIKAAAVLCKHCRSSVEPLESVPLTKFTLPSPASDPQFVIEQKVDTNSTEKLAQTRQTTQDQAASNTFGVAFILSLFSFFCIIWFAYSHYQHAESEAMKQKAEQLSETRQASVVVNQRSHTVKPNKRKRNKKAFGTSSNSDYTSNRLGSSTATTYSPADSSPSSLTASYSSSAVPYAGSGYNSTRATLAREAALESYTAMQRGDWREARAKAEMAQVHAAESGDPDLYNKVSKYRADFHSETGIPERY